MAESALSDFFSCSSLQFYCASSLVVLVCSFILFFILLYFFVQLSKVVFLVDISLSKVTSTRRSYACLRSWSKLLLFFSLFCYALFFCSLYSVFSVYLLDCL